MLSIFGAAIYYLPAIGPLVSLYNAFETKDLEKIAQAADSLTGKRFGFEQFEKETVDHEAQAKVERLLNELKAREKKHIQILKKGIDDAKYGIIGNLLTIAGVIALIAVNVFSKAVGAALAISFAVHGLMHAYSLYKYDKSLKELLDPALS